MNHGNGKVEEAMSGTYIIVLSGYLDVKMMADFMDLEVFRAIEKGGTSDWMDKLDNAIQRAIRKITYKITALNEL